MNGQLGFGPPIPNTRNLQSLPICILPLTMTPKWKFGETLTSAPSQALYWFIVSPGGGIVRPHGDSVQAGHEKARAFLHSGLKTMGTHGNVRAIFQ